MRAVEIQRGTNRVEDRGVFSLEIVGRTLPQSIRSTVQRSDGQSLGRQLVKRRAFHFQMCEHIAKSIVPERVQPVATAARRPLHGHLACTGEAGMPPASKQAGEVFGMMIKTVSVVVICGSSLTVC